MAIDQTFRVLPLLVLSVLRFISQRRIVSTFQLRAVCQRAGNDAVVATAEGLRSHAISVQLPFMHTKHADTAQLRVLCILLCC